MNKYQTAVEMRGGIDAVAAAMGCGRDRILRRTNGTSQVTEEQMLAVEALPVIDDWQTISKLKHGPAFREKFARMARKMPLESQRRKGAFRLLAETLNQHRGVIGGKAKAKNNAKK